MQHMPLQVLVISILWKHQTRVLLKELNWTDDVHMVGHSMGGYLATIVSQDTILRQFQKNSVKTSNEE